MRWSPHPVTLRQLQYLCAVAHTGSFHRAAALCRVSQPSLSSQLAAAERALGTKVFERDRRRVLTTRAGAELLDRARRLLEAADELCARGADPLAGTLRIGVLPTIAPYLLPHAAPALRRALPRLTILWSEDKTRELAAALHAGRLDAALVALPSEVGAVESATIGDDPFVLAAPPGHPLVKGRGRLHPRDLAGADLLLLAEGHCLRDQAIAACKRAHHAPFSATSLPTLVALVAGGAGVTLLPSLALPAEKLVVRQFAAPAPKRTLTLIWRPGSPDAALRQIAAVLRQMAMPSRNRSSCSNL
jgi:LysR family transcriptional regulator, hydrogen peroxide-inducible genes activator